MDDTHAQDIIDQLTRIANQLGELTIATGQVAKELSLLNGNVPGGPSRIRLQGHDLE